MLFVQFCEKVESTNIDLKRTNDGFTCEVTCPMCKTEKSLASYISESSGKTTFSISNFKRHYNVMHQNGTESISTQFQFSIENASTPISTNQKSTRSNCENCDMLKKDLIQRETELFELANKVKSFDNLKAIIAQRGK